MFYFLSSMKSFVGKIKKFILTYFDGMIIIVTLCLFVQYNGWGLMEENLSEKNDGSFRMNQQFYLPLLFGAIGGYALILIQSLERFEIIKGHSHVRIKFTFIGAIAGVASVNLLNPTGTVSQIIILALIAGLSGVSYLSRNALVESIKENEIFNNWEKIQLQVSGNLKATDTKIEKETKALSEEKETLKRVDILEKYEKIMQSQENKSE